MNKILKMIFLITLITLISLISGCTNKDEFEVRTDPEEVERLIKNSLSGKNLFPTVWFDTTDHLSQYLKPVISADNFSYKDYSVEFLAQNRVIIFRDSCASNNFNQQDTCRNIELEAGNYADAIIATIYDTIVCRYNIIKSIDSSIVAKDVTITGKSYCLAARLGNLDAIYRGWTFSAVGDQQLTKNFEGNNNVVIDSVVIITRDDRFTTFPNNNGVDFISMSSLPRIANGDKFNVWVFPSTKVQDRQITDCFLHYSNNGKVTRVKMNGAGPFILFDIVENSGSTSGSYSQIGIEAFPDLSLRDDDVSRFSTHLWAMPYKLK